VRGGALIDAGRHASCQAATLRADFPLGSWFDVYDYGVGDAVFYPLAASAGESEPASD